MHLLSTNDLFVPQHEWDELLRIVAVEGYPPVDQPAAAAIEALLRADVPDYLYATRAPEATIGGVIIKRSQ